MCSCGFRQTQLTCASTCVPGASAAALHVDVHPGRAGAQQERHSRTVPPGRHMGEPIAAAGRRTLRCHTPGLNCPFPPLVQSQCTFFWFFCFFLPPPWVSLITHSVYHLFVCAHGALDDPRLLSVSSAVSCQNKISSRFQKVAADLFSHEEKKWLAFFSPLSLSVPLTRPSSH